MTMFKPPKTRLPQVGTTIFTVMSALAAEHQAVNLGQGFPDFPCDPALLEGVNRAMQAGHNQYPPMAGVAVLRDAVARVVVAPTATPPEWLARVFDVLARTHRAGEGLPMTYWIPALAAAGIVPTLPDHDVDADGRRRRWPDPRPGGAFAPVLRR